MKNINLELSHDEALILFEKLASLDDKDALPADDKAEEIVFWNIQAQLEKTLSEPLDPKYKELVNEAKARLIKED